MKKRVVISVFLILLMIFTISSVSAFSFFDWIRLNKITGFVIPPGDEVNPVGDPCYASGMEVGICSSGICPDSHFEFYSYNTGCNYNDQVCCMPITCGDGYCSSNSLNYAENPSNCCYDCPCDINSNEPICENVNIPHECRGCESDTDCFDLNPSTPICDTLTGKCASGCGEGDQQGACSTNYPGKYCTGEWELVPGCDPAGYNCTCAEDYFCDDLLGICVYNGGIGGDIDCDDDKDNDGDGLIDLLDPGCANDPTKTEETIDCAINEWLPKIIDGNCYGPLKCHDAILATKCSECPCSEDYICFDNLCISGFEENETEQLSCYGADGYCETECADGFIDSNNPGLELDCSDLWGENLKCCVPARQSEKESEKINTCLDDYHTEFGSCSQDKPFYCTSNGNLERDCETCECPEGQICNEDNKKECLTPIQEARKLARLSPESKVVIIGVVVILGIATLIFIAQHNSNKKVKINKKPRKRRKKKK